MLASPSTESGTAARAGEAGRQPSSTAMAKRLAPPRAARKEKNMVTPTRPLESPDTNDLFTPGLPTGRPACDTLSSSPRARRRRTSGLRPRVDERTTGAAPAAAEAAPAQARLGGGAQRAARDVHGGAPAAQ